MARTSWRKLFLFGRYSLALLPPKKWLTEIGIKKGDKVKLEFDKSRKRIVVRLAPTNGSPASSSNNGRDKKPKTGSDDFQPIPQI